MRRITSAFLAALLPFVSACVTEGPPEPVSDETTKSAGTSGELEFGRTLQDLDKRVDAYVYWLSQPGTEAARRTQIERSAAVSLVRLYEGRIVSAAQDRTDPLRQRIAVKALAFAKDPSAVRALSAALSERGDARLLTSAAFALSQIRSPLTPARPLIDLLSHPDGDVRNNVLLALFHSMDARRSTGANALDPLEQRDAVPLLEAALFDRDDPSIRGHAAACLGTVGDVRSVDALMNVLPDPNPFVRTRTALALGRVGDAKAIPALVAVIDETDAGTPRSAVTTALRVILERNGRQPPAHIADTERAWNAFLRQRLGPDSR